MPAERWISVRAAAEYLGVSRQRVYVLARTGRITAKKLDPESVRGGWMIGERSLMEYEPRRTGRPKRGDWAGWH